MRILLSIHHELSPDQGASGVTYQLGAYYEALGHCSRILSLPPGRSSRGSSSDLLERIKFPWYTAGQLLKLDREYDVADLSSGDGWVYQALRRERRLLLVTRSHGLEHLRHETRRRNSTNSRVSWKYGLYHGGFRLWEVAQSFRNADLSLFLSDDERSYAIEHLSVRPEQAVVVENGIPDDFLGLPLKRNEGSSSDSFKVALIGTYSERKINSSPRALNRLMEKYPDLRLGFFGTSVDSDVVLKDYLPKYHRRITVLPRYAHASLPSILEDYNVLLFPSVFEGFPLVVYEAMACGLVLVGTNLATLQSRLRNEINALFVPVNDPDAIEAAISRLIANRSLLAFIRANGYAKAQECSWSRISKDTLSLYEEFRTRKLAETVAHAPHVESLEDLVL